MFFSNYRPNYTKTTVSIELWARSLRMKRAIGVERQIAHIPQFLSRSEQDSKQSLRKPKISKKQKKGWKRITKRKQVKSVATHLGLCQELTPGCPAGKTRPGGVTLCLSSLSICTNKQYIIQKYITNKYKNRKGNTKDAKNWPRLPGKASHEQVLSAYPSSQSAETNKNIKYCMRAWAWLAEGLSQIVEGLLN